MKILIQEIPADNLSMGTLEAIWANTPAPVESVACAA